MGAKRTHDKSEGGSVTDERSLKDGDSDSNESQSIQGNFNQDLLFRAQTYGRNEQKALLYMLTGI